MSIHWNTTEAGTKKGEHRTIKHSRAYCSCPNGDRCGSGDFVKAPSGKVRKVGNLEARRKGFDAMKKHSGNKKPGSNKK